MPRPSSARARKPRPRRPPALGVRAKLWLTRGPRPLFGEGKADLLEWIDSLGSLRRAAARMGMSYRYAWGLLRELERAAGFAFLERGGAGSGGRLRLSARGRRFV